MPPFSYVYILQSEKSPDRYYVGHADDLAERLRHHNTGNVRHTSKFAPWTVKAAIALRDRSRAIALEHYLKTHAGRKFSQSTYDSACISGGWPGGLGARYGWKGSLYNCRYWSLSGHFTQGSQ